MKVSLNWMKWYGAVGLDVPIDELVERIGAQLGGVDGVENLGEKYQGVIVAKVVECRKHENSDHLNVCLIDDVGKAENVERDENGLVQVVCGAPNVRAGLLVAWLPPGSTVPESAQKDPFVLGARELRGVRSNGMLASARELALGDSHDGILELDDDAQPGADFAETYGLNDYIIDIENKMFTHRPDCFGQLGVAREIAGISGRKFTSPDWYLHALQDVLEIDGGNLPLQVRNEASEVVPRFMVVPLSGVTVGPSPLWLQTYLLRVGVRPISNVVDITNYMMLLTGQPMHAYDYDKVKALDGGEAASLVVRYPKQGEQIALLNGKTITPRDEAIMIATETVAIGLGGIMGGAETEVDDTTRNIILECASFDMYSVRRSGMAHGIFTDALTRFNKGQSPLQNDEVTSKAIEMLRELADAKVAGPVIDDNHVDEQSRERRWVHPPVPVTTDFINTRLGFDLTAEAMQRLLENVECQVQVDTSSPAHQLTITAPFWRTDIETREDVVEEIGRLYGFDKLPLELPRRSITPAVKDLTLELKSQVRSTLATAGASEVLTYSFVHGDLFTKAGQTADHAYKLSNALSPDLQYYRTGLTPSLLDKVHLNVKAGYGQFALFELGKVHYLGEMDVTEPTVPNEDNHVSFVTAHKEKGQPAGSPYYLARKYLGLIVDLRKYGLSLLADFDLSTDEWGRQLTAPYEPNRSAVIVHGGQIWGVMGEYRSNVRRALKLPAFSAGFEVHLDVVAVQKPEYEPLPRFPKVTQDITLRVPLTVPNDKLDQLFYGFVQQCKQQNCFAATQAVSIYSDGGSAFKNVSYSLSIASYDRTMTDGEVSKLLDDIAQAAQHEFGAERV